MSASLVYLNWRQVSPSTSLRSESGLVEHMLDTHPGNNSFSPRTHTHRSVKEWDFPNGCCCFPHTHTHTHTHKYLGTGLSNALMMHHKTKRTSWIYQTPTIRTDKPVLWSLLFSCQWLHKTSVTFIYLVTVFLFIIFQRFRLNKMENENLV